jgi:hypothetical protein
MSTSEGQNPILGDGAVLDVRGNYQPVHFEDTVGAIVLGILAGILLIGWMRSEARYRKLLTQKGVSHENTSLHAG